MSEGFHSKWHPEERKGNKSVTNARAPRVQISLFVFLNSNCERSGKSFFRKFEEVKAGEC